MIREDYILKMIEQAFEAVRKMVSKKKAGEHQEAVATIEGAFRNILGLDYRVIESLPVQGVISMLRSTQDAAFVAARCVVIGELLKARADLSAGEVGDDAGRLSQYQRALRFLLEGLLSSEGKALKPRAYSAEIDELSRGIGDPMPLDIAGKLNDYRERIAQDDPVSS